MVLISTFFFFLTCLARSTHGEDILVEVEQGWLSGSYVEGSMDNKSYYMFKGIPYAKPPIGSLRFKDPQPVEAWDGVRNATEHGSMCPQYDMVSSVYLPGSEDCLFLNIYSPNITTETLKAVIVFIHGGDYKFGSGNVDTYGADYLTAADVVVVTLNYRLDALGFLAMYTKDVPGNAGLKDQVMALKWVQNNIAKFGGDPDNVTLMGQSAGSASVTLHIISPMSKGLFHKAICLSGVANNDFSIAYYPERRAIALARIAGYEVTNNVNYTDMLDFLQNVSYDKLVNTTSAVIASEEKTDLFLRLTPYVPVVEKDVGQENIFLSQDPIEALDNGNLNDIDVIMGYTSQESTTIIPFLEIYLESYQKYPEMFIPSKIMYNSTYDTILDLSNSVIDFYIGNKSVSLDSMQELVSFSSNSSFVYDIHRFARRLSKHTNVYFYKFGIISDRNYFSQRGAAYDITGPAHLDDLFYYFDPKALGLPMESGSTEYEMIKMCTALVTNFANCGNPTPNSSLGYTWSTYDSDSLNYLDLTESPSMKTGADETDVQFWKGILESDDIVF